MKNIKVTKSDYLVCDRCKIDTNTEGRMIPCPRGGCEAEIRGEIVTTVELKLFKK